MGARERLLKTLEGAPEVRPGEAEQQVADLVAEGRMLTEAERTMLAFALNLADDEMASRSSEFTAEDRAAVDSLRRMATRRLDDDGRCHHCRRAPERCDATGCGSRREPAPQPETAPALALPQLVLTCPMCGAKPGAPCTSHNGTRIRRYDTHQARRQAWEQTAADPSPSLTSCTCAAAPLACRHCPNCDRCEDCGHCSGTGCTCKCEAAS